MNKYITLMLLVMGNFVFSQVGIATETPHASSDLDLGAADKALYLNRIANTSVIANPQPGMMIYDLSEYCVKTYGGNPVAWSGCFKGAVIQGTVASLTCGSVAFSPNIGTKGIPYTGQLIVPYTGGDGGVYNAQSFVVNGLTFTLPAGNFNNGSGNLLYSISGTPAAEGTTTVSITAGGKSCTNAGSLIVDTGA